MTESLFIGLGSESCTRPLISTFLIGSLRPTAQLTSPLSSLLHKMPHIPVADTWPPNFTAAMALSDRYIGTFSPSQCFEANRSLPHSWSQPRLLASKYGHGHGHHRRRSGSRCCLASTLHSIGPGTCNYSQLPSSTYIFQVLQQYFVTGQLIRMCDSIVYGKMPGKGRRVWETSQFRFRVLYSVPQMRLHGMHWRQRPPLVSDPYNYRELPELGKDDEYEREKPQNDLLVKWAFSIVNFYWSCFGRFLRRRCRRPVSEVYTERMIVDGEERVVVYETNREAQPSRWRKWRNKRARSHSPSRESLLPKQQGFNPGEASWVNFFRTVQPHCRYSITYDILEGDADRCPADLPVVPMQISLRDVIAMAFAAGTEATHATFEYKVISMQGNAGTISSAQHPILGALIHFSPNMSWNGFCPMGAANRIDQRWLSKLDGLVVVAGQYFTSRDRRYHLETEGMWARTFRASNVVADPNAGYIPTSHLQDPQGTPMPDTVPALMQEEASAH
jgi:hypothetical protein